MKNFRKSINFLSFFLLPITLNYFAPVLIVQASMENTFTAMHIIYGLMILSGIFLGGAWCSYVCPFGALQELIPGTRLKLRLPNIKWLTGSILIALIVVPIGMHGINQIILPYHMTEEKISISTFHDVIRYYIITGAIFLITITLGKRGWCRYICPMYMFNYIGMKIRKILRIASFKMSCSKEKCTHCKQCNKKCLMGLDVEKMVSDNKWNETECIKCGECVDACHLQVLKIKWTK